MQFALLLYLLLSFTTVGRVEFVGVHFFKSRILLEVMGLKKGALYSPPLFKSSLIRLQEFYRKKGFFEFRIDSTRIEKYKEEKVKITIFVREGKRKIVGDLNFRGFKNFSLEQIKKKVEIEPPIPYDADLLNEIEARIIDLYTENGFPFVDVSWRREEVKDDTLKIVYLIKEGPKVYIREVILRGYRKVRRKILEREVSLKHGDLYRSSKIFETTRRLYSTGLFRSVRYELKEIENVEDSIDVVFIVEEVKPAYINTGFGYHSPQEFQIRGGIGHLNIFNNGQRAELRGDLLFTFKEMKRERVELYYSEPYLLGFRMEGRLHPFYELDRNKDIEEYGVDIQFNKLYGPYLKLTYALEWKTVKGEVVEGAYINTNVFQAVWDSRSPLLNPSKGVFAYTRMEVAGGPLGGQFDFFRWVYDNSIYLGAGRNVVALRLRLGYQRPYGRSNYIPPEEQFTLGGEGTLRGYDFHSVGVYVEDVGYRVGNVLYLFNFEFRGHLYSRWGYVVFVDYGGLFASVDNLSFSKGAALSSGLGLRYYTALGPLRLDWGIKLKDRSRNDRGRVYIGIGHMF